MTKEHINRAYNNELQALRDQVLLIAARVEKMVANSLRALEHNDVALARETINYDKRIDRDELAIDRSCIEILAQRQPLGHDLRFIVSVIKMVGYFERQGDLAVKVCQRVIKLNHSGKKYPINGIVELGSAVQNMLKETLEAFLAEDYQKACAVLGKDKTVDAIYNSVSKTFIKNMASTTDDFDNFYRLFSITRWLERIGDHCTNIAELIIFMIKGEDVRHKSAVLETGELN